MRVITRRPIINTLAVTVIFTACLLSTACSPAVITSDADNELSSTPKLSFFVSNDADPDRNEISDENAIWGGEGEINNEHDGNSSADTAQPVTSAAQETLFGTPLIDGKIAIGFGGYSGHTGIDYEAEKGTEIFAAAHGIVLLAKSSEKGYGRHIIIDHGAGVKTVYAHCDELLVQAGQKVAKGDVIAKVGNTGHVSSPCLHFELRIDDKYVDPADYLEK